MPGSKEDFFRNNAFLLSDLYGHILAQEPLHWGSWNLQFGLILPWSSLLYIYIAWNMPMRRTFFKNSSILHFLPPNYLPFRWGGGVMKWRWKWNFLVSLPYRCYKLNLVKIGSLVLEKKMLTDDGRRRTPSHSNRSPEWLRWPKHFLLYSQA